MDIKYLEAQTGEEKREKVYGEGAVRWLYESPLGRMINNFVTSKFVSKVYGAMQSSPLSERKVIPFIKNFDINMDEFEMENGRSPNAPFSSFNNFFIRPFKEGMRVFPREENKMGAPCEARYFGWNKIDDNIQLPVKGQFLQAKDLVGSQEWGETFKGGPGYIARLCPVDYHRFHYPDSGKVLYHYPIRGKLDSVNPLALKKKGEIFIKNERYVSILETDNFGKLAYIEVGATCVGKIVQSHNLKNFKRGEEKGYFLFGGSTVIVLGEPGRWELSDLLTENTHKGREVYYKLGMNLI